MTYAPDLLDYHKNLRGRKPAKFLTDPELTKMALSESSPSGLVHAVAKELEYEKREDIVSQLSTFERARILMIMNENPREAGRLFEEVIASTEDKEIKGKALINRGIMEKGMANGDQYFRRAIDEGYVRAYAYWAHILKLKDSNRAKKIAEEGLSKGDDFSCAFLIKLASEDQKEGSRLIDLAQAKGINIETAMKEFTGQSWKQPNHLHEAMKDPTVRVWFCHGH